MHGAVSGLTQIVVKAAKRNATKRAEKARH